jgi:hypothetical protein
MSLMTTNTKETATPAQTAPYMSVSFVNSSQTILEELTRNVSWSTFDPLVNGGLWLSKDMFGEDGVTITLER